MYVLTLIGAPGTSTLTGEMIDRLSRRLAADGATPGRPDWLAAGEACDLPFFGITPEEATGAVHRLLPDAPLDIFAQAEAGRRKAVFLADMESTIIAEEMLDELATAANLGPKIANITARAMAGELDFEAALEARVALLKGLSVKLLETLGQAMTLNPGAATLVRTLRARGTHCALVTGGFEVFAERVAALCGFHERRANRLETKDGAISGTIAKPVLGREAKRQALSQIAAAEGLSPREACAVGDGANDLDMLEAAGLGVGYRAKPLLRQGIQPLIDHGDLTAILYLQGFRRADFVTTD